MDPSTSRAGIFTADGIEWKLRAPNRRRRFFIYLFDVSGKDTRFHICTASGKQNIIGVPVHMKDGRSDGFLQELGDPPIVFRIERTDGDSPSYESIG